MFAGSARYWTAYPCPSGAVVCTGTRDLDTGPLHYVSRYKDSALRGTGIQREEIYKFPYAVQETAVTREVSKTKPRGLSLRANYTDRATAAWQRR
jgi:hypothetical protein